MAEHDCPICGSTEFEARSTRIYAVCAACHASERTRLMWLVMEARGLLRPGLRVLHIAPEYALAGKFHELFGDGYEPVDIDPERYAFAPGIRRIDLVGEAATLPSERYDLIIHAHVMEHIPCNITAVLHHLHRALRPGGAQICCIPIIRDRHSSEDLTPMSREEMIARFGEDGHVRIFGGQDIDRTLGMIFALPDAYDVRGDVDEARLRRHHIPRSAWTGWSPNSVLVLDKDDLLLKA